MYMYIYIFNCIYVYIYIYVIICIYIYMFLNVVGMRTTSEGQLKIEYYIYMELACMFIVVHVTSGYLLIV